MVDLKNDPPATPKKSRGISMTAVKNWLMPEKNKSHHQNQQPQEPQTPKFQRMPESFLRSIRRRSLRVKRTKSLILPEKRKSDSFVNSQEWTLSRTVPDLRLGIVGSLSSGKSALVHRYLTGSYMQEESPEGGRFKKEILVDNQSFLLLIRDEGGPPELQFTAWVDAVIFVFSLENESSFNAIYNYYTKMSHYRNSAEIPLILVGTQDAISENNPRVIDDSRARKLANDLKRCTYYETCATYGLNVERVFQDACQKIVQQRLSVSTTCLTPTNSRPSTPNNHFHPITATTGGSITTQRQQSIVNAASQQQQQQHPQLQQSTTTNNGFSSQMSPSHNSSSLSHKESIHPLAGRHTLSSSTHYLHHRASADKINCAESLSSFKSCVDDKWNSSSSTLGSHGSSQALVLLQQIPAENNNVAKFATPHPLDNLQQQQQNTQQQQSSNSKDSSKDLPTPSSTPTTARKSRRRSNLFAPSKKNNSSNSTGNSTNDDHHNATHHNHSTKSSKNNTLAGDFGSGRAIPLKQGYLYKRSSKPLNKEWKKKYVTLCDDGRLTYHPSLHDYMDNVHGKEISLQYVTVKVPGQKPRGSKSIITVAGTNNSSSFQHHNSHLQNGSSSGTNTSSNSGGISEGFGGLTLGCAGVRDKRTTEKVLLSAFEAMKDPSGGAKNSQVSGDEGIAPSNSSSFLNGDSIKQETPNVKKRHRRMKSSGVKNSEYDDPDGYEFYIVSLDNKQWHFEASSSEERDEWVAAIEQQILNSLQLNESNKGKQNKQNNPMEATTIQAIRTRVPGNGFCVDCDAANPDWASLNLGVLMCIECSGIHRNLGSHISRVRSLDLDEWPPGHLSVMLAIGNSLANSVWESRLHQQPSSQPLGTHSQHPPYHPQKPTPCCGRELKERFIRAKYEAKEFLQPLSNTSTMSLGQQLVDAVCSSNIKAIIHLLALATPEEVNSHVSPRDLRTPLHLACAMGNLAVAQLLIWHNANVKAVDQDGRTCLAYARAAASIAAAKLQSTPTLMNEVAATNSRHLVDLLLSYGCPEVTSSSTPSLIGGGLAPAANMSGGGGGAPGGGSGGGGTLPRRRGSQQGGLPQFEKLPSSVI